jgi:hypothetical protein
VVTQLLRKIKVWFPLGRVKLEGHPVLYDGYICYKQLGGYLFIMEKKFPLGMVQLDGHSVNNYIIVIIIIVILLF